MREVILFLPELILSVTALAIFGLAIAWRGRRTNQRVLLALTLGGLAIAFIAMIPAWGESALLFSNLVAVDALALFFKTFALIAAVFVVLSAWDFLQTRTRAQAEFYSFVLFAALTIMLAASARNIILIYLAIESLSIVSTRSAGLGAGSARRSANAVSSSLLASNETCRSRRLAALMASFATARRNQGTKGRAASNCPIRS